MVIQIDTREQKYEHVLNYFEKCGIKHVRSKCVVGDYVNLENPMVVVDRKQSLQEVCGNVTQQHERFTNELKLANELGYKLIIVVEEPNIKRLSDVPSWYNWRIKRSPKALTGKVLYKIMKTIADEYHITWEFTTKADCGKTIERLLKGVGECQVVSE